jgi:hypothetical protein
MNRAIITPAEADVFLANYPDWLALETDAKVLHIDRASVHVQTAWVCVDTNWDEPAEDQKEAVAHYAYADFLDVLYTPAGAPASGELKLKRVVAGDVEVEKEWFKGTVSKPGGLQYPDTLMSVYCSRRSAELVRC